MSDLMFENFNRIYQLLSRYHFQWNCSDELKCIICRHILINAYQSICGCNFCHRCIVEYKSNGGLVCPGTSDECKYGCLSRISIDNRVNKLIFESIVECPNESCSFTCELKWMERHLEECLVGIDDTRSGDECEHWRQESGAGEDAANWKNELLEMRMGLEGLRSTVAGLTDTSNTTAAAIESIRADIDSIKVDRDRFEERLERMENAFTNRVDELTASNKDAIERMLELVQVIGGKIDVSVEKFDETERRLTELENRLDAWVNTNSSSSYDGFHWNIGDINNITIDKSVHKCSDFFYLINNFYKTKLNLWNYYDKFGVQLSISPEPNDVLLRWPLKVNVIVKICDGDDPDRFKERMKVCTIDRPGNTKNNTDGDWIVFEKSDLSSAGLLDISNCVIKCYVHFNY